VTSFLILPKSSEVDDKGTVVTACRPRGDEGASELELDGGEKYMIQSRGETRTGGVVRRGKVSQARSAGHGGGGAEGEETKAGSRAFVTF